MKLSWYTQYNIINIFKILKDSPEGELMRQVFRLSAELEIMKIENQKLGTINNDLLENGESKSFYKDGNLMR